MRGKILRRAIAVVSGGAGERRGRPPPIPWSASTAASFGVAAAAGLAVASCSSASSSDHSTTTIGEDEDDGDGGGVIAVRSSRITSIPDSPSRAAVVPYSSFPPVPPPRRILATSYASLELPTSSTAPSSSSFSTTSSAQSSSTQSSSSSSSSSQHNDDDDSYPAFTVHHRSLLKKYLTPELWSRLSRLRTSQGTTLEDMIRPGLALPIGADPPRRLGVLVGDAECYSTFRELLDPIIREYHGIRRGDGDFEEWSDPELPMESHFLRRKAMGVVAGGPPSASSSNATPLRRLVGDEGDGYGGVIKSGDVADDDLEDVDEVIDDDDVIENHDNIKNDHDIKDDDGVSPIQRSIASEQRRRSILRRHPTIINNPRLMVTNRPADPDGKYVISTRIRVARSIEGFRFPSAMSRSDRRKVERLVGECVRHSPGPVLSNGTYVPLLSMTIEGNLDLIRRHVLFDNPNEWMIASGLGRDWPDGRALYANVPNLMHDGADGKDAMPDFMIWVNEEDHLRMMCLRSGGDIQGVFATLTNGVRELEREMRLRGHQFVHDSRLGYLTSCPTNVGTAMRASVHVRLMNLGRLPGFFDLVERLKLEVRGKYGESDRNYTGVFDVSNLERLGKSEVHLINVMVEGVAKLIELERRLEAGEEVDIDAVR
jgi:hypothetical protein